MGKLLKKRRLMEQRELRSAAEDTSPQEPGQRFRAGDSMDVNSASVHSQVYIKRGAVSLRLYYPASSAMS